MKKLFISILLVAFATLIGCAGPNPIRQNPYTTNYATAADAYARTAVASITNGLATTNYVNVATNGLATAFANYASTNYVIAATNDLIITTNKIDATFYNLVTNIGSGGGTSGALTNNETRNTTFINSLTASNVTAKYLTLVDFVDGTLVPFYSADFELNLSQLNISANGLYAAYSVTVAPGGSFYGDGTGITGITGSNSIAAGTIDTNRMDATAYAAFIGGGDALTNNNATAVTLADNLTVSGGLLTLGAGSAQNTLQASAALVTVSASITANGSNIRGRTIIGTNFVGNGASLTNIHGSNSIAEGTISTNRMDATAYAAFIGGGITADPNALTNRDTRAIVFQNSLTISNNGNAGGIRMFDAIGNSVSFSNIGAMISFGGGVVASSFVGDGSSLSDLSGTTITAGIVADARIADEIARDAELVAADTVVSNGVIDFVVLRTNFSGIIVTNNAAIGNDAFITNTLTANNIRIFNAVAQGYLPDASGVASHAQGYQTIALGDYSHAEGITTLASNSYSHAEGENTIASGIGSHAEGYFSLASGTNAHAEGFYSTASGLYSHAEGDTTIASGESSHAEGQNTIASGLYSHAGGRGATAGHDTTWVWSSTNVPALASTAPAQFSVYATGGIRLLGGPIYGNGAGLTNIANLGTAAYSNAAAFRLIGDTNFSRIYVTNNAFIGNNVTIGNSLAQGYLPDASGSGSHAQGNQTTASGDYSHAEGSQTTASGNYSHAEGVGTVASGDYSHAEGYDTTASGESSHAEGLLTTASGDYSHAGGRGATAGHDTTWVWSSSTAPPFASTAPAQFAVYAAGGIRLIGSAISGNGSGLTNLTLSNMAGLGTAAYSNSTAFRLISNDNFTNIYVTNRLVVGAFASAPGLYAFAQGESATAVGVNSHAEGYNTLAYGLNAHAEGNASKAYGSHSHAQGEGTIADGNYSHAEGYQSKATNVASHAEGYLTIATNQGAHAEGVTTTAGGYGSHAEGGGTKALGPQSHAEGITTTAANVASHAEGNGTSSGGIGSHAEGYQTIANNSASHAQGYITKALNQASHSAGIYATAQHDYSWVWNGDQTGMSEASPFVSTAASQFSVNATGGIRLLGSAISGNGSGLTNLNFSAGNYATNSSALTNVIDMTKPYSAATVNNTLTLTGLSGVSDFATNVQWAVRFYTNAAGPASPKAVNFPASWIGNTVGQYITNQSVISIVVYPGFGTNVVYRNLK